MPDTFLKEYISKISNDISTIFTMIEKDRERDKLVLEFMAETRADRKVLKEIVSDLQSRVDKLADIFGVHKKKGLWALLVAAFSGAAIASGTLNYQKIVEKFLGLGH